MQMLQLLQVLLRTLTLSTHQVITCGVSLQVFLQLGPRDTESAEKKIKTVRTACVF